MGNIQKQMSLHMPIYRNKEQNSNTDNLTHPKLQLLQHAVTFKHYDSVIKDVHIVIKHSYTFLFLFFVLLKIAQIHKIVILIIVVKRLKAKSRRLGLCIHVEQLQRQAPSPM